MDVTYDCPQCTQRVRAELAADATVLRCPGCQQESRLPAGAMADGELRRCLVCPSGELFVRKDFSQRWGILIIVTGFAISTVAWAYHRPLWTFAILFATALLDLVAYLLVGNLLQCYRCRAEYRGVAGLDQHAPFSLETHERYRQESARLAGAGRVGQERH